MSCRFCRVREPKVGDKVLIDTPRGWLSVKVIEANDIDFVSVQPSHPRDKWYTPYANKSAWRWPEGVPATLLDERDAPVIYVAGPFLADDDWRIEQNARQAETVGLEIARLGAVPLVPHRMYRNYYRTMPEKVWRHVCLILVRHSDALVTCDTDLRCRASTGTTGEINEAARLGLPIFEYEKDYQARIAAWIKGAWSKP